MSQPTPISAAAAPAASQNQDPIVFRNIAISLRSRIIISLMRLFLKPLLGRMAKASPEKIAKIQLRIASAACPKTTGPAPVFDIVDSVPGYVFGTLQKGKRPVILWLHGGAFFLPAAPNAHLPMVSKLCGELDCDAFLPDYRLAPMNPFPAGLNDCEAAYLMLLERGYSSSQIVIGGDSAGGNLLLALLHRLKAKNLPLPACAIPVSPVTELSRVHNPAARFKLQKSDPLLPITAFQGMITDYVNGADSANPEVSPLYMNCEGLPPLFFLTSTNEILMDDSVMLARRTAAAGVSTQCHVWPTLPHAFPVFEPVFPEAKQAREDMQDFIRAHLSPR